MAKQAPAKTWNNRIIETGEKPASEFNFNPRNWRQHPQVQRDALNEILSKVGWVTGVVVNARTGNLVDGHARIEEALKNDPGASVPYTLVDLSEEEEQAMLLLLDPIGNLAVTDTDKFAELAAMVDLDTSGLLEVVASLSRQDLIETAEIVKEGGGLGELMEYMRFGGVSIPLTDEELAELKRRYETYVEEHQTYYGFPAHLLGLDGRDPRERINTLP